MTDYDDFEVWDEPEPRERRSNRYHWCETCHGHTGPGSPCSEEEPEEEEEDDD